MKRLVMISLARMAFREHLKDSEASWTQFFWIEVRGLAHGLLRKAEIAHRVHLVVEVIRIIVRWLGL